MRIEVEGIEAVARARLAMTDLAIVRERDLAEAHLVPNRRRRGGCLDRLGRLRCRECGLPGAGTRKEQEGKQDGRCHAESHLTPRAAFSDFVEGAAGTSVSR